MGHFAGAELDDLVLCGSRLTLRPWRAADAVAVHAAMQDEHMHDFLARPYPYSLDDARAFVTGAAPAGRRDAVEITCAIEESGTGAFVGSGALRLPTGHRSDPDIGYWIAPTAQGHGYAAEATGVLAEWGFAHGLDRIEVHCDVRNLASARTALRCGFRFEGVRRDYITDRDGRHDLAVFGRTGTDAPDPIPAVFAPLPRGGLTDGVIALRAVTPADAAAFTEQEVDEATVATGFTGTPPTAVEIARMAARAGLDWVVGTAAPITIVDVATGAFAGSIRLRQAGPPDIGGIGYAVHPDFRGRGYTARALRLLVPWAFEQGGFARLELGAKTANVASQRAALAAGFTADGVRAARLRNPDGSFSDEVRFALINPAAQRIGAADQSLSRISP